MTTPPDSPAAGSAGPEGHDATRPITSLISKSEKALLKLPAGSWQHRMLQDNLDALRIALALMKDEGGAAHLPSLDELEKGVHSLAAMEARTEAARATVSPGTSQSTLLQNRLASLAVAKGLLRSTLRTLTNSALLMLATGLVPVAAQPVPLSEEPSCARCNLSFHLTAVLGDLDDPASPGPTAEAARLADGRIAVSSPTMGPQVLLYESDGAFIRSIGTEGEGPGELMAAPLLRPLEDGGIALFDPTQSVIHHVDANGSHSGSTPIRMRAMVFAPHPEGWAVSGLQAAGGATLSLHIVDLDGEPIESMAESTESNPRRMIRQVAVTPDGGLWAAQMNGGSFEQWSPTGELLSEYRIENADLHREAPQRLDFRTEVPPATVADLTVDERGRVWIWIVVPDPDFEPGPMEGPLVVEDVYDTRVLVFEPETGRVRVRHQFDELLRPLGNGWAYHLVETELGDRKVWVGRIELEGEAGGDSASAPEIGH